jgi:hypothetical protein
MIRLFVYESSYHRNLRLCRKHRRKEMGGRYLFICMYVWLEKYLSCDDYRRIEEDRASKAGAQSHPAAGSQDRTP